jgi:hypothetical protein
MNNFQSIKAGIFDAILPPKADPKRVGLVSAGNPDVLHEAAGLADYANPRKRRKRGGRAKIDGVRPKPRLDRRSRGRKFADGGTADDLPATSDDAPSLSNRGFVDALMANPKVRAIAAGLAGIQKATPVVMRAIQEDPTSGLMC